MRRKLLVFLQLSMIFILLIGIEATAGEITPTAKVNLFIEGNGYTIGSGEVSATTVLDAIDVYAATNKRMEVSIDRSRTEQKIISIGGILNGVYGEDTGWYGVIVREGVVLRNKNFLSMKLEDGDDVFVYYGRPDTVVLPSVGYEINNNMAIFTVVTTHTVWEEVDGKWQYSTVEEFIPDVKIHLVMPNGMGKILVTNELGQAILKLNVEGIYEYYAEGYTVGYVPSILKTKDESFVWGLEQDV